MDAATTVDPKPKMEEPSDRERVFIEMERGGRGNADAIFKDVSTPLRRVICCLFWLDRWRVRDVLLHEHFTLLVLPHCEL